MSNGKRKPAYALHTFISPVHAGILLAFAMREDLKRAAAFRVLERVLREELDRLCPGAFDDVSDLMPIAGETTRELAHRVAERVLELLRARSRKESAQ